MLEVIVSPTLSAGNPISAVVDTGFSDFLALPASIISSLQLTLAGDVVMTLADGTDALVNIYVGYILWHESWQPIDIISTDGDALIGMALLNGSRLIMDVHERGAVSIISLL